MRVTDSNAQKTSNVLAKRSEAIRMSATLRCESGAKVVLSAFIMAFHGTGIVSNIFSDQYFW